MTREREINNLYFDWMYDKIANRDDNVVSYVQLLMYLHSIDFEWQHLMDENRALDGIELRDRFAYETSLDLYEVDSYMNYPCSILEMMLALSIRCEEHIMCDDSYGDRTSQWFWEMIVSLGLGRMKDGMFDKRYVDNVVSTFNSRSYEIDGKGGLFYIPGSKIDMRKTEIWYQMMYYLSNAQDNNYI